MSFHNFYVVMHPKKRKGQALLSKVLEALAENGFAYVLEDWVREKYPKLPQCPGIGITDCDALLSVGGDGTLLEASRIALERQLPLLGINVGRVGFLTEIEWKDVRECFALLRQGAYCLKDRMLLEAQIGGGTAYALNDVVVSRGDYSKSIDLDVFVGEDRLGRFIADGYIVSTPTGSTGYSLSAGGPVVSPELNCMLLTPVCAHSLQNRSILIPPDEKVAVRMHEKRDYRVTVSCDGREAVFLQSEDTLLITAAKEKLSFIQIRQSGFFHRVQSKLNQ